jgi:hypothetical protein
MLRPAGSDSAVFWPRENVTTSNQAQTAVNSWMVAISQMPSADLALSKNTADVTDRLGWNRTRNRDWARIELNTTDSDCC